MRLAPGQDTVLSLHRMSVDCRVVAAAGAFVLLKSRGEELPHEALPAKDCVLSFMDGMVPMVWDGEVQPGAEAGELRFQLAAQERATDRRSAVRLPVVALVTATVDGVASRGQMLDISAGGLRYRHPVQLGADRRVRVGVTLPRGGPYVEAEAVVRQSTPTGVTSVEFTAMHGASVQDIGAWTIGWLRESLKRR